MPTGASIFGFSVEARGGRDSRAAREIGGARGDTANFQKRAWPEGFFLRLQTRSILKTEAPDGEFIGG